MVVGFDARVLARGVNTGIEEYSFNLFLNLWPLLNNDEIKVFYNAYKKVDFPEDFKKINGVKLNEFGIPNRLFDICGRLFKIPKIDKLIGGVDVFFSPHFFITPLSKKSKRVLVFHDLSFERFPEFFSTRQRWWHFLVNSKNQAENSEKIIAVSNSTKSDLINLYKIPPEKIEVIYCGVGGQYSRFSNNDENLSRVRLKYNLPEKFILCLSTVEPRKNIVGIIKAFEIIKQKNNFKDYYLIIAGRMGWLYEDILKSAKSSKFSEYIKFSGFVDSEDKPYLYNLAEVFVYPSFFEGFGFPPLEAMACGVPVITSNNSSLPEIAGDSALMVDPHRIDEIAFGIEEILSDNSLKKYLIEKGFENSKKFSWQKTAEKTFELIKSV